MLILIPTDVLLLFISASLALAVAPGPDNLFVLSQSALFGSRSGLLVTLGLCTGLLVHIAAATLGVAAIFQTSPLAFNLLKALGAAYLVLLAVQAFRAGAAGLEVGAHSGSGARALYFRGIIMNVTNPKVALFFSLFSPSSRIARVVQWPCKCCYWEAFSWFQPCSSLGLWPALPASLVTDCNDPVHCKRR